MDQLLNQRLEILKNAGQISDEITVALIEFSKDFEKKYAIKMTEENSAMLITHLAMALARITKGEEISELDEVALNEIRQIPIYSELPEFYEKIEKRLQIVIPETEKGFIAAHVATLIDNQK